MRKEIKILLFAYFTIVLVKAVLAAFIPSPTIFSDEYTYAKLAQAMFENGLTWDWGIFQLPGDIELTNLPFLYSIFIAVSYVFSDMTVIYLLMKWIGVVLSSLIIFPVYFLARDFVNKRYALFGALMVSLLAMNFTVSNYVVAENLFFPLFMFSVYFIYKAFDKQKAVYFFLSGLFIALAFMTKTLGIVLVPVVFLVYLFYRPKFRYLVLHYLTAFIVVLPQLYLNVLGNGVSILGLLGGYKGPTFVAGSVSYNAGSFINWLLLYSGYVFLAAGFILVLYFFCSFVVKEKKYRLLYLIVLIVFLINLLVVANQANKDKFLYDAPYPELFNSRPIGRYIDPVVSLIFITGFIAFIKYKVPRKVLLLGTAASSMLLFISSQLVIAPLFPFNNQSLTYLGAFHSALEYLFYGKIFLGSVFHWLPLIIVALILFVIPWLWFAIIRKKKLILALLMVFILFNSLLTYGVIFWNSGNWDSSSQASLGKWFDDYDQGESVVLVEEIGCEDKTVTGHLEGINCTYRGILLTFWLSNDLRISNVDDVEGVDYIFSIQADLPYEIVAQEGNIFIYKVEKVISLGEES